MAGGRPKGSRDKKPRQRRRDASPLPLDNSAANAALRADVALYAGVGLSVEQIAQVLEIDIDIVRTQFAIETTQGNVIELARNFRRLRDAAEGGSVNAQKALNELLLGQVTAPAAARTVGKKAAANAAAAAAAAGGNMFAPPATPRGVGKKELAQAMSETAHVNTSWADLTEELGGEKPN